MEKHLTRRCLKLMFQKLLRGNIFLQDELADGYGHSLKQARVSVGKKVSGSDSKQNPTIDFKTFLGHKKPTSLLKHLSNPSKDTTCLEFGQLIKARFVCWTGPEKHLPEILNLRGVKCSTTQKLFLSVISGANNKISIVKFWPSCST